ncbi:uncharacterized protein VTP21DRAFT_6650 [Calcarisporiella thermophila]|uniref:uncharacterized protein n=1 Tax=Calcarisporiella thermophila TaxID=911321 RepID=UPI003743EB3B
MLVCIFVLLLNFAALALSAENPATLRSLSSVPSSYYKHLVVFGDSYSDNGHPRNKSYWVPPPPYLGGRTSNGYMWNEYLAKHFGANLHNYAYSGATADNSIVFRPVPSVNQQLDLYYTDCAKNGKITLDPAKTLHAIWIGVNDLFDIFFNKLNAEKYEQSTKAIGKSLKNLYEHGARQFLLLNIPPIEHMPVVSEKTDGDPKEIAEFRERVQEYNEMLERALLEFLAKTDGDAHLVLFDSFIMFDKIINRPPPDFCDVEHACYYRGVVCSKPNCYLWWDTWHPTTYMHGRIADAIFRGWKLISQP